MLNRACLEKALRVVKQITIIRGQLKRLWTELELLKGQSPVLSKKAGRHFSGMCLSNTVLSQLNKGMGNEDVLVRCAKSIIKVMNVRPKTSQSCWRERTAVITKGGDPYVIGGPVLVEPHFELPKATVSRNLGYCALKEVTR